MCEIIWERYLWTTTEQEIAASDAQICAKLQDTKERSAIGITAFDILGPHCGDYEEYNLLGYDAV
jgi:hypothetical protein